MSELPRFDRSFTIAIVVRHAEKAATGGSDPHLSEAGQTRARALARALQGARVTAVITTQFVRTAETAAPTARAAGVTSEAVPVQWDSVPGNAAEIAAAVRRHRGGVVLVVGHSNTVPDIVAALGAPKPSEICESEYDRLEIVAVPISGPSRLIESRYGAPTPVEAGCASMH
jgi:phosphohistidine phosphatase SixA